VKPNYRQADINVSSCVAAEAGNDSVLVKKQSNEEGVGESEVSGIRVVVNTHSAEGKQKQILMMLCGSNKGASSYW